MARSVQLGFSSPDHLPGSPGPDSPLSQLQWYHIRAHFQIPAALSCPIPTELPGHPWSWWWRADGLPGLVLDLLHHHELVTWSEVVFWGLAQIGTLNWTLLDYSAYADTDNAKWQTLSFWGHETTCPHVTCKERHKYLKWVTSARTLEMRKQWIFSKRSRQATE